MTTELTLREKVLGVLDYIMADPCELPDGDEIIDKIADLLSATGAPAYIRVADDLRGVVREEEFNPAEYLERCATEYYLDGRRVTKEEYEARNLGWSSQTRLK